eukprot:1683903-Alexandrium_andersonii.AAC.1
MRRKPDVRMRAHARARTRTRARKRAQFSTGARVLACRRTCTLACFRACMPACRSACLRTCVLNRGVRHALRSARVLRHAVFPSPWVCCST